MSPNRKKRNLSKSGSAPREPTVNMHQALWSAQSTLGQTQYDGHPLHFVLSSVVSTTSCCWIQISEDERVRPTTPRNTLHFKPIYALWQWARGKTADADTLEAVVADLHTGSSGQMVALFWTEEAVEFGSPQGV